MLTETERLETIERIARSLERFDDATLAEMARLTDVETREVRPMPPPGTISRRSVLSGFAAGAGAMGLAALGLTYASGTGTRDGEDLARLRAVESLSRELEVVGLDDAVGTAVTSVDTKLEAARIASADLHSGIASIGPEVESAVASVDPVLATKVRDRLLDPAQDLVSAVDDTVRMWREELAPPIAAKLDQRNALRQRLTAVGG